MPTADNAGASSRDRLHVPKTAEIVAGTIRTQIVRGEIPPGTTLPSESELMGQFGVSRSSLREAFRILESEQLLVIRRGYPGGARVTHPDITVASRHLSILMQVDGVLLSDVFQARALIEPVALRLLAARADRETATEKLLALFAEIERLADPRARAEKWTEFFLLLFDLAGNRTLRMLYGTVTEVVRQEIIQYSIREPVDSIESSAKAVRKTMRLVAAGRGDEAADFWRGRMLDVSEQVAQTHSGRTVVDAFASGN
ncbi:MAG TPA: GntR family transcriptional regulator [Amycolatopsis sp.]|nr:GntR family transcriptional regulator [Amycolatopsis sp.]